jgi:hypothetical protein
VRAWSRTDDDARKTNINTVTMNADRNVTVTFELKNNLTIQTSGDVVAGASEWLDGGAPRQPAMVLIALPDRRYQLAKSAEVVPVAAIAAHGSQADDH